MLKGIVIGVLIMIGVLDVVLFYACFHLEDKDSYEAYQRWKERKEDDR